MKRLPNLGGEDLSKEVLSLVEARSRRRSEKNAPQASVLVSMQTRVEKVLQGPLEFGGDTPHPADLLEQ